jgi:hypothetical protein
MCVKFLEIFGDVQKNCSCRNRYKYNPRDIKIGQETDTVVNVRTPVKLDQSSTFEQPHV